MQHDVPMTDVSQYLIALNQLIKQLDGVQDTTFYWVTVKGHTTEVSYRKIKTGDEDNESIADEASIATEEDLSKELTMAEKDFKAAAALIASNPEEYEPVQEFKIKEVRPTIGENPWNTVKRSNKHGADTPPASESGQSDHFISTQANPYGILDEVDDDDEEDDDNGHNKGNEFGQSDSAFMQQSIASDTSDPLASPENTTKQKNRVIQKEKLLNIPDHNHRERGWATINRILEHGDPSAIGIEDLCYYICNASKNFRASKKDHLNDFYQTMTNTKKKGEFQHKKACNEIADKAMALLVQEDQSVFNKV
jgi:hypothetical protein